MVFTEYDFSLIGQDIFFATKLKPEQINVKDGDSFIVKIVDGQVILLRKYWFDEF